MENEPTRTGKRLEGLAVEDLEGEQASVTSKNRIANAAKEVWMRVRGVLAGKKVRRGDDPGSLVVCGGDALRIPVDVSQAGVHQGARQQVAALQSRSDPLSGLGDLGGLLGGG